MVRKTLAQEFKEFLQSRLVVGKLICPKFFSVRMHAKDRRLSLFAAMRYIDYLNKVLSRIVTYYGAEDISMNVVVFDRCHNYYVHFYKRRRYLGEVVFEVHLSRNTWCVQIVLVFDFTYTIREVCNIAHALRDLVEDVDVSSPLKRIILKPRVLSSPRLVLLPNGKVKMV